MVTNSLKTAACERSEGKTTFNLSQPVLLIALPDGQRDWQTQEAFSIKSTKTFPVISFHLKMIVTPTLFPSELVPVPRRVFSFEVLVVCVGC